MKSNNFTKNFKRISSIVLSLAIILSSLVFGTVFTANAATDVWNGSSLDWTFEGEGTEANPYKITSAAELAGFAHGYCMESSFSQGSSEGLYFELTTDIYLNDVSNSNWMNSNPNQWVYNNTWTINAGVQGFRGNFNGNGHTVYGMYYSTTSDDAAVMGLIPFASGNAVISNVNIKNAYFKFGSVPQANSGIGGIVGAVNKYKKADGTWTNAHVTITKCVVDDTVDFSSITGALWVGGIVGLVRESYCDIQYCGSSAKFNNNSSPAGGKGGGIVAHSNGWASTITVKNSYSIAAFTTDINNQSSVSDGTLYFATSFWQNYINSNYVTADKMLGDAAVENMPDLGWDVWNAHSDAYPTIKGSTNYIEPEVDEPETDEPETDEPGSDVINVWNGMDLDQSFAGSGTAEDPYEISTAAELAGFVYGYVFKGYNNSFLIGDGNSEGLYFEITDDIYINDVSNPNWMNNNPNKWMSSNEWIGGNGGCPGFRGNLNGNGHTVYGMYYPSSSMIFNSAQWKSSVHGLIPWASGNAVISNINLKHSYVQAFSNRISFGGILGFVQKNSDGTASNVTVSKCVVDDTNDFSGLTNAPAGGIVGPVHESNLTLEYCGSAAKFNSSSNPAGSSGGGLVASLSDWAAKSVTINNCYCVVAFSQCNPTSAMADKVTANAFYSDHSWWASQGVNLTYKAKAGWVGANAYFNLTNFDWNVWQANDGAYPTIKGSTNYVQEKTEIGKVWNGTIAANYAGGTGTVNDPYLISTPEQLKRLTVSHVINDKIGGDEVGKYYALTNDIYLNDVSDFNADEWLVNGATNNWRDMNLINRQINNASKGLVAHIDGNGHTVYGLYYLETESDLNNNLNLNAGLFFNMGVNSSITDLHIRKSLVYGKYAGAFIGSIGSEAGFAVDAGTVTLSGCSVDESVGVYGLKTGGLVGVAQASFVVENCYSSAIVGGDSSYGGVYGDAWGGAGANHTFRNVYTTNAYPTALTTSSSQGKIPAEGCRSYENVYSIYTHESDWEGIDSVSSFEEMTGLVAPYWYGTDVKQLVNRGIKTIDINGDGTDTPDAEDISALTKVLMASKDSNVICDCNGDDNINILDLIRLKKIVAGFFA